MPRPLIIGLFLTLAGSGCSLMLSPGMEVTPVGKAPFDQDEAGRELALLRSCSLDSDAKQISQADFRPGQEVQVIMSDRQVTQTSDSENVHLTLTYYVGAIESVDGEAIVLNNVVRMIEYRTESGGPIPRSAPYLRRQFRNTGVARRTVRMPDHLTIPLKDIGGAFELSPSSVATLLRHHSTISSSPGMDRLTEIEKSRQTPDSDASTNHKRQQTPPGPAATSPMEQLRDIEPHFHEAPGDPSVIHDVKPGQHVRVLIHSTSPETPDVVHYSIDELAGTIVSLDDDVLVLNNAVKLREARFQTGVPVLNRVPYLSRLFKNTSVRREEIWIPGNISIARSEIQGMNDLTSDELAELHESSDSAQTRVDFFRIQTVPR